jgi:type VI secretion system protein ImpC
VVDEDKYPVRLGSPASDGVAERRDLGFRLLVVSDLAPDFDGGPIAVDREGFESVLERLAPHLELEPPDALGSGRPVLPCSFAVTSMRHLHPDGIVEAQPLLASLAQARTLLEECLDQKVGLDDIRDRVVQAFAGSDLADSLAKAVSGGPPETVSEPTGTAEGEGGDAIDTLLSQVEVPGSSTPGAKAAGLVEMLTAVFVPSSGVRVGRDHLEGLIHEIDLRLSRQVAAIQDEPKFQRLESAWRGLKFLVDRLDFRGRTCLEVLPASRDEFLQRFFDTVFHAEYEGTSTIPLNMVVADYGFGRSVPDLEAVRDLARFGESLSVPFVAAMDPSYWGVRQAPLINKLPDLVQKAQGSEYGKWNRFRSEPSSAWVVLAANRFLLRPVWSEARQPPELFTWCPDDGDSQALWGSGVWAMAAAVGQSFAASGIRFPCVGPGSPGVVEDLPVVIRQTGSDEPKASPLEIDLEDRRAFQLAQAGFAPLVAQVGSDQAFFNLVGTFHKPARYEDEEATRESFLAATLPYRLFAGAVAHELDRLGRAIGAGVAPEETAETVRQSLVAMISPFEEGDPAPDAVEVEVEQNSDEPALLDVTARIRPGFDVYGSSVDLIVGTTVPR